jgi:NAD(P)-dependent dehydrogenase (short-subunit alcohol dehydrogenase family)
MRLVSLRHLRYTRISNLYRCQIVRVLIFSHLPSNMVDSGVTGFVRSHGALLVKEGIMLNAICPNVVRTGISTSQFYDSLEGKKLLVPMRSVIGVFESLLGEDKTSGQIFEVGPNGVQKRPHPEYMDQDTADLMPILEARAATLHQPSQ